MQARSLEVVTEMLLGEQHVLKAEYGLLTRNLNRLAKGVARDRDISRYEERYQEIKRKGVELAGKADKWAARIHNMRDACLAVARAATPATLKHMAAIHHAENEISCSATLLTDACHEYAKACEMVVSKRSGKP